MTREEALKVYFANNKKARGSLSRLQKWNSNISVKENSKAMRLTVASAWSMQKLYKLKYHAILQDQESLVFDQTAAFKRLENKREAFLVLHSAGLSGAAIGRVFGISREYVRQVLRK